ncbi:damage-inducible protein DinB [Mucilaginibacter sp. PPCGB 2223]|uniref:DinB family protein n=1 Tax=Mucilaginibacter sp. PPCGB 2223 TaxID=1886027 RepID=UPI000825603A|nr:DinB family protein [Mucilaginibacter sp. PPCGB 2223]OCX52200.1 damage-inducible protein DinB [Mucilaginibacter sp. PPCGB 2223]
MNRPQPGDYIPYQTQYLDTVADGDIVEILNQQYDSLNVFLRSIPESKALYAYADGKWTVNESIGHLTDTERIMAYRLLRFSRKDTAPLPGFEQDDYVANAHFNGMKMSDLVDEFLAVRKANLYLFNSLTDGQKQLSGISSGHRITVNAFLYIIAGHANHHVNILKKHYL